MFKIGKPVEWTEEHYWSTKHPDECGYNTIKHRGCVISFDDETVVVSASFKGDTTFLSISKTKWIENGKENV